MNRANFSYLSVIGTIGLCLPAGAGAKPAKARHPVQPVVFAPPDPAPAAATPANGPMTPKEVQLRPTTPAEAEANAIWSTRAALNIAALQCQFSPYLATVRNYNDFLRQHADELDRARMTMVAHFKRYDGTQAQNSFDRYTTQTYNSFSTLDAQFAFCDQAALTGRIALTVRKGELGKTAAVMRNQVRASLIPVEARALLTPIVLDPVALPTM